MRDIDRVAMELGLTLTRMMATRSRSAAVVRLSPQ